MVINLGVLLFLACGFSGHGFMHSPAVGRLISKLVVNGSPSSTELTPFSIERFEKGITLEEKSFV